MRCHDETSPLFRHLVLSTPLFLEAEEIVLNNADSGAGSLRQAIADVTPGGTITFDAGLDGATIELSTGEIVLGKAMTIDASALPNGIVVSRSTSGMAQISRIFSVTQPDVILDSLTIENGKAPDATAAANPENGGGILSGVYDEGLTLRRCTIRNCEAGNGHPSNNFGGFGGGIMNNGTLTIEECTIHDNSAGDGFSDGTGGSGGGIAHNTGILTVINSTITGNRAGHGDSSGIGIGANGGDIFASGKVMGTDPSRSSARRSRAMPRGR